MKYTIISGEYQTVIDRISPKEAATDAMNLWKLKKNKPILAKITTVVDSKKKEIYLSTSNLMKAIA